MCIYIHKSLIKNLNTNHKAPPKETELTVTAVVTIATSSPLLLSISSSKSGSGNIGSSSRGGSSIEGGNFSIDSIYE